MINIKYVYNRNKKSTAKFLKDFSFEQMEREVQKLFNFGKRPLLFYYLDDGNCKILILDDEDLSEFSKLALDNLMPSKIYLNYREKIIAEIENNRLLEKCFTRVLLSHQRKLGRFSNKKLIGDLHSLKDSFEKSQMKNSQVKKLLSDISKNIKNYFIDEVFDEEIQENGEHSKSVENRGQEEVTFSSIKENESISSFFSRHEISILDETIGIRSQPKKCFLKDKNVEKKMFCKECRMDLNDQIRFECETCLNLKFCDECVNKVTHKHSLKPIFIINDSKQKINALSKVFKKLKFNRAEWFFERLKWKGNSE